MIVGVTGAGGFIGRAAVRALASAGHTVVPLVRAGSAMQGIPWHPNRPAPLPGLDRLDAALHLAGEPVAPGRWTAPRRARIRGSRVDGTRHLCAALAALPHPPRVLLCASATGYYGNRGDEWLTETSAPGEGFLAGICRDWEDAAVTSVPAGVRVVRLRFGMVLGPDGGALGPMRRIFRLGLGGPLGSGRAWVPWIGRDDVCAAIRRLLEDESLEGPFNLAAPHPVRQRDFARALGRALRRPAILPVPRLALRVLLGRMADEVLLASARVRPAALEAAGFAFASPTLDACLAGIFPKA